METSNNNIDPLSNTFNIEPTNTQLVRGDESGKDADITEKDYDSDFEFSRNSIRDAILKAEENIEELSNLAKQSQQARAFEVVFLGIKTILDGNKDLVSIGKMHKEMNYMKKSSSENNVQNNMFIGTTENLADTLEKMGISSGIRKIVNVEANIKEE